MGFVALQVLSYYGYISIDYNKVKESVKQKLDADGDGKLTTKDLVVYWNQFKDVLTYNVPGMGGFSAGFMLGLYF